MLQCNCWNLKPPWLDSPDKRQIFSQEQLSKEMTGEKVSLHLNAGTRDPKLQSFGHVQPQSLQQNLEPNLDPPASSSSSLRPAFSCFVCICLTFVGLLLA